MTTLRGGAITCSQKCGWQSRYPLRNMGAIASSTWKPEGGKLTRGEKSEGFASICRARATRRGFHWACLGLCRAGCGYSTPLVAALSKVVLCPSALLRQYLVRQHSTKSSLESKGGIAYGRPP